MHAVRAWTARRRRAAPRARRSGVRATAVAAALLGLASLGAAKDAVCSVEIDKIDERPFPSEKRRGDHTPSEPGPSRAPDAQGFTEACERYLQVHFAARAHCTSDDECSGGNAAGMCGDGGTCNCNPERAGHNCEIDVKAVCAQEDFWTAFGGDEMPCAGTATRTTCAPSATSATCGTAEWCSTTDRVCVCAPDQCWSEDEGACVANDAVVHARAWASAPASERDDEALMRRTSNFGVALAGGGTRALVAGIGLLRALHRTGVLQQARYLGANSGGGWAAAIYTYADPAIDDETLLGAYVPPEQLSNASLLALDARNAAACARAPFGALLLTMANHARLRYQDMWSLGVAKAFFEPYGFGKLMSYFGYTAAAVAAIRAANPALRDAPFDVVREGRPFLLLAATMLGPRAQALDKGIKWKEESYQPLVFSPLYVGPVASLAAPPRSTERAGSGAPPPGSRAAAWRAARLAPPPEVARGVNVSFHCDSKTAECAGIGTWDSGESADERGRRGRHSGDGVDVLVGGVVEPFAFGAAAARAGLTLADGTVRQSATLDFRLPATPFSLAAAAGISSSALAPAVSAQPYGLPGKYCRLAYLAPALNYMSPLPRAPRPTPMSFGDGMSVDNNGVLGMLARGVDNVVLLLSTETPLDVRLDVSDPDYGHVDESLRAMFGFGSSKSNAEMLIAYKQQCFAKPGLKPLLQQLVAARRAGKPVVAQGTATVVGTDVNGLGALDGKQVGLFVIYLSRVDEWEQKLADSNAAYLGPLIRKGNGDKCDDDTDDECGPLARFPHYRTISQNAHKNPVLTFDVTEDYKLISSKWTNLTDLTTLQVTTLAHLSAYVGVQSSKAIVDFLGIPAARLNAATRPRAPAAPAPSAPAAAPAGTGRHRDHAGPIPSVTSAPPPSPPADAAPSLELETADEAAARARDGQCCGQCVINRRSCWPSEYARRIEGDRWGCFRALRPRADGDELARCIDTAGDALACAPGAGAPTKTFKLRDRALARDLKRVGGCERAADAVAEAGATGGAARGARREAWAALGGGALLLLPLGAALLARRRHHQRRARPASDSEAAGAQLELM